MPTVTRRAPLLAALAAALLAAGCLLAAGGAAAGGGIYYTSRGAEAVVHGDVPTVTAAGRQAFERLGVTDNGYRDLDAGERRELYGETDDGDVTVTLTPRTENATKVEVRVKTSAITWDKEMARSILEEIRTLRGG